MEVKTHEHTDQTVPEDTPSLVEWVVQAKDDTPLADWIEAEPLNTIVAGAAQAIELGKWKLAEEITGLGHQKVNQSGGNDMRLRDVLSSPDTVSGVCLSQSAKARIIISTLTQAFNERTGEDKMTVPLTLFMDIVNWGVEEAQAENEKLAQRNNPTAPWVKEEMPFFPYGAFREMLTASISYIRRYIRDSSYTDMDWETMEKAWRVAEPKNLDAEQTHESVVSMNWILLQLKSRESRKGLVHEHDATNKRLPAM